MADPFSNGGGGQFGNSDQIPMVHTINQSQIASERAISAYKQNIAAPDVHVADRNVEFVPKVVGEDGEELTPERRAEMMKAAGVKPMFDENGKRTNQNYFEREGLVGGKSAFDDVIETEQLGKSAIENREGYRIVKPRELEIETELTEETIASVEGTLHVPGTETEIVIEGECIHTSGHEAVRDIGTMLVCSKDAMNALYRESGDKQSGAKRVRMSRAVRDVLKNGGLGRDFPVDRILGVSVVIDDSLGECVRFYGDPAIHGYKYAAIFLATGLLPFGVDTEADTARIERNPDAE